jgi:hypothetical protein
MSVAHDRPFVEPRDGDVVVVRASIAPDGRPQARAKRRYAVIQWGDFQLVSDRLARLSRADAIFEARFCASERGRDAWDSAGTVMTRLPRLPLVYRGVGDTFAVSLDVTDYADAGAACAWKSTSHLSEAQALDVLVADGVSAAVAMGLIGKAPMPDACA